MGIVVNFDYATWSARYPEFGTTVTSDQATLCFNEAVLYQDNTGAPGGIWNATVQLTCLNMLSAHIAQLYYGSVLPTGPQLAGPLVGRIEAATEGSVNVTAQNDYAPGTTQWYQQTKYGSSWYAATQQFRTMRYIVSPRRFGPGPPGFGGFGGWYGGRGY